LGRWASGRAIDRKKAIGSNNAAAGIVRPCVTAALGLVLCAAAIGCSAGGDTADGEGRDDVPAHVLDADLRRSTLFDTRREFGLALAATGRADVHLVPVAEHPADLLADLHDRECASAAVLEDVGVELSGDWMVTDLHTAVGQLTVTQRTSGVTAAVEEVLGNVIFSVTAETATPVATVDDAQPTASVGSRSRPPAATRTH
jgi:hypothetical protein